MPKKLSFNIGDMIHELKYLGESDASIQKKHRIIKVLCDCGKIFEPYLCNITSGKTKSCGCKISQSISFSKTTHGLRSHKLYNVHRSIKNRCLLKSATAYSRYGGRGIKLCDEWCNDFMSFYNWAMENGYKEGLSIDRINNNGNYEPSNCRWVSDEIQARNTRRIMITNTSGYRGVYFEKQCGKWRARITINSKSKHIGSYSSSIEAAQAYDSYVIANNLEHTINGV